MSTYIIGDVQGCYVELQQLLERINYHPDQDHLAFAGDLVNRGPDSLSVLRFLKTLRNTSIVLGNHDLYLLILGYKLMPSNAYTHTLDPVIDAPDALDLLDWLRHQKILLFHSDTNMALVHAGIPPQWSIEQSLGYANEIEQILQGPHFEDYLLHLFGDTPTKWNPQSTGYIRWRYITNAFTRMRFCTQNGQLDFIHQDPSHIPHPLYKPWFEWRTDPEEIKKMTIFFGHWALLGGGQCNPPHCYATDTGCAWGKSLSAIRLEDKQWFSVPSRLK